MIEDSYIKNKKILLTGGAGFLGKKVNEKIRKLDPKEIIIPRSNETDLRIRDNCRKVLRDVDTVIHLAAKVGGIGYNQKNPASLFFDNLSMGINLMEEARLAKIKKFIAVGTICSYPKYTPVPFKEENLWDGYPEETNASYGLAKKMLLEQSKSYRKQYNFNSIFLLPVNLYGPGDNFDLDSSHVIPAIIRKVFEAKEKGENEIKLWGTGSATREFLYVDDAAEGIVKATELYNDSFPVNLGSGIEISISDLAKKIIKYSKSDLSISWDTTKPDGQPRRCLDISKAKKHFDFTAKTSFEDGLKKTIDWYKKTILG